MSKIKLKRKKPAVAYAGSCVQQNHGELLENHGYLLWDIESRTFSEYHIHNEYGYLTVDVVDGKIPQWVYDEVGTKLPKQPRLRLRFTNTEPSDMKLRITELKKLFKVAEVTVTRTDTIGQLKTNNRVNKNIVGNVKDETFQNQLIKDYLERQFLLDGDDLDKIQEIHSEINSRLSSKETGQNILWLPKTFEFSNMFSYGEDNVIRFDRAKDIIGIFAPNASGKSSLFDALSFCIFDKSSRSFLAKNIMNNRKTHFSCKFHFKIDDVDYFIERRGKLINKGKNVKVDVDFWREQGGIQESLNGEQRRDTNHIIQQYLGTYDDFVLTVLSLQGNNALFIDKSQSERKDILAQFIGVDIFDKLYQEASEENRDTATLIKKFKRDDFTTQLVEIDNQLKTDKNEYKLLEVEQKGLKKEQEDFQSQIIELNSNIVQLKSDSGKSIQTLEDNHGILVTKKKDVVLSKSSLQDQITHREEIQNTLHEILDGFDEEELENKMEEFETFDQEVDILSNEIEKINIKLDSLIDRKEHLDSHKYNENCEICMENSESIIEQKKKVDTDIKELKESLSKLGDDRNKFEGLIEEYKPYQEEWDKFCEVKTKEDKIDREISTLINKLSTKETEEVRLESQISELEKLIEEYYSNEEQIKKNQEVRNKIQLIEQDLRNTKKHLNDNEEKILSLNGKISSLKSQKQSIQDRIDEVRELEEQQRLYEYYLNSLGRDGVSYELISKTLPMIEGEVNNILAQIVDFGMNLEMDGKNINAHIVYDDQKWSLELCSGMERFISGLAIRIALINISNLPRPNFLVIDEGFGTLDNENLTSLYMLFSYLKTQFDFVMVISHIDSMRDVVDTLMEIKKEDGFSKVKF